MNVANLRPNSFEEFVGKDEIKESLKIYINAALQQKKTLDHLLFYGYAGNGKTSLAGIVAKELNKKIHYIQGPTIKHPSDVLDIISMLEEGDIIFVDEIHNVEHKCLELFYSILEDFVVDIKIGKDLNSMYNRLQVPKFTFIASTTNLGKLPEAFIERFPIKFYFDTYKNEEIFLILKRLNLFNKELLEDSELQTLAHSSKGNPRIAINLYRRFFDYRFLYPDWLAEKILNSIGIFNDGLEKLDLNYLRVIYNNFGKPIGIKTISQSLSVDQKTIESKIEPFLLKRGYIMKKTNGRILTSKGFEIVSPLLNEI
ncbi:Holliday junction branch migration DNA helicase RuvB [Ureaplasma ceti]|uniref:Holliday junction branch migration DNA helicase RuvB n=1 Tax=Ureaplasma ceti TaxID=3119530 RepID=A0ABP9U705_9BACT